MEEKEYAFRKEEKEPHFVHAGNTEASRDAGAKAEPVKILKNW